MDNVGSLIVQELIQGAHDPKIFRAFSSRVGQIHGDVLSSIQRAGNVLGRIPGIACCGCSEPRSVF